MEAFFAFNGCGDDEDSGSESPAAATEEDDSDVFEGKNALCCGFIAHRSMCR